MSFTLAIVAVAALIALLAGAVGCLLCVFLVPWVFVVVGDRAFVSTKRIQEDK